MNSKNSQPDRHHANEEIPYDLEAQDEISIADIFARLWRRRAAILIWSLAFALVILAAGTLFYLLQPKTQVAVVQFKLETDGIDKGEYPNGMKFSPTDILSTSIVDRVYKENQMDQYMTFPEFKSALDIIQTSNALRLLELEYSAKLGDKKLGVQDRQKLEAEFAAKKAALKLPIYELRFTRKDLTGISHGQMATVLNDILKTWSEFADRVKGALKYRISIVTPNIIDQKALESEEYLVVIDILKRAIERVNADITQLQAIPGAKTIQLDKDALSLYEMQYRLQDLEEFKLNAMTGLIRQSGLSRNIDIATGYIKNRLFELQLQKEEAIAKKKVYDEALQNYLLKGKGVTDTTNLSATGTSPLRSEASRNVPTMIPQFGASFLDSLIQLGQEHSDAEFRQKITNDAIETGIKMVDIEFQEKYYQTLLSEMEGLKSTQTTDAFKQAAIKKIKTTFDTVSNEIVQIIKQLGSIYQNLSKYNLQPESQLYTILEPVTIVNLKAVSPKKLLMFMILAGFLAEAVLLFVMLIATPSQPQRKGV